MDVHRQQRIDLDLLSDDATRIGAAARDMLVRAAADNLRVAADRLRVDNGRIHHDATGRSLTFGAVAAAAAGLEVPQAPALKPFSALKLIGKPQPRVDIPAKVDGSARFGIDVQVPGMVVAALRRAPSQGGSLVDFDPGADQNATRRSGGGGDSIGDRGGGQGFLDRQAGRRRRQACVRAGSDRALFDRGTARRPCRAAEDGAVRLQGQDWRQRRGSGRSEQPVRGHLRNSRAGARHHGANECHGSRDGGSLRIVDSTQGVEITHAVARQMTGLSDEQIIIHRTLLGGGFGRRLLADFAQVAIVVAKAVGRPVKVIWSREEDFRYDAYRPPMTHAVTAALGHDGLPTAMAHRVVSPSHMLYIFPRNVIQAQGDWAGPIAPPTAYDPMSVEGLLEIPYAIAAYSVEQHRVETPLSVSVWRTTGHGPNNFVLESVIDDLAHAAGKDPLAYRLLLAAADARAIAVLSTVAEMCDWAARYRPAGAEGWRWPGPSAAPSPRWSNYPSRQRTSRAIGSGARWTSGKRSIRGFRPPISRAAWSGACRGCAPRRVSSTARSNRPISISSIRSTCGKPRRSNPFRRQRRQADRGRRTGPVPTHAAVCNAVFAATGERIR